MSGTDWGEVAVLVAVAVPSVMLHEVSHGVVALWFGDDTAKRAGRLTLNPIAHIDPFGTILLPLLLALAGPGAFGYAKPVPVNVRKLRNPRQHSLYVSLAGPATNLALAAFGVTALRAWYPSSARFIVAFQQYDLRDVTGHIPLVPRLLFWFALVNVILAVFNLLPIPPLDGSALVERVLPTSWWPAWLKFRQWGFLVLLVVIFYTGILDHVFTPAIQHLLDALS